MNNESKTAVIFGGTSGVGLHTATILASRGWKIFIIGREERNSITQINQNTSKFNASFIAADISIKDNIENVVTKIRQQVSHVDALFITAGTMRTKLQLAQNGMDMNIVLNYLAQVWIIKAMHPLLNSATSRHILLVGGLPFFVKHAKPVTLQLSAPNDLDSYKSSTLINATLQARFLLTIKLSKLLSKDNITVNIFHPGYIPNSHLDSDVSWYLRLAGKVFSHLSIKNSTIGADLVTNASYANLNGCFIDDRGNSVSLPQSFSDARAEALWQATRPYC